MASFRDSGLELNIKPSISGMSLPNGDRVTLFAITNDSTGSRYYTDESPLQIWAVDSSGGRHEITNDWLESKTENISSKLDFIYPAVSAFMSAGLIFRNSSEVQTLSSDLRMIGDLSITGSYTMTGPIDISGNVYFNNDISAYTNASVYGTLMFNKLGTPNTLDMIVPFFIRSSGNRLSGAGWDDPRLFVIGKEKVYNEFKQSDRGLRFTVINKETLDLIHDAVYDTAGSQFRVTDLAFDLFKFMNNSKYVGVLNSRESWETIIWRKQTVESVGVSASNISAAYWNLSIGSLIDQFDRFGLVKAIRASSEYSEFVGGNEEGAGSQYCAIFEGSDIYVDSTIPSATYSVIYPTNKVCESWIPKNTDRIPVDGETQRAQLVGWFINPKQMDISNNIKDTSVSFVTTPVGRETDSVRDIQFVNISGGAGGYNVKIDNFTPNILAISFNSVSGMMNLTNHIIEDVGFARIDKPRDTVNVEFSRLVTPIGSVLDFAGRTSPTNWSMCDGSLKPISSHHMLFDVIDVIYGPSYFDTIISGNPTSVACIGTSSISGIDIYTTNTTIIYGISAYQMIGRINQVGENYLFTSGQVLDVSGIPTFITNFTTDVSGYINYLTLPNYNGRTSIGAGATYITNTTGGFDPYSYTLGVSGGEDKHMMSDDEMRKHRHFMFGDHNYSAYPWGPSVASGDTSPAALRSNTNSVANVSEKYSINPVTNGTSADRLTTGYSGNNQPFNIMQPYVVANKIIRYK